MNFEIFWKFLAGLGVFLFGVYLLEEGISHLSGRAFKKMIRRYTSNRLNSITTGTFVTAILQSSSLVSLMTLAFVGAGIMSMESAIGVIMGSNLGTTATGWLVATLGFKINIESFALPLIGLGGLGLIFLQKKEKAFSMSKLLMGFGFLFLGLDYMKSSMSVVQDKFDLTQLLGYGVFVYFLAGAILTGILQSSSAMMAITLTAISAGILDLKIGASIMIGADLGTTVTVLLGAVGGTQAKKRVAFSHFFFNLFSAILGFLILYPFIWFIGDVLGLSHDPVLGLALFHTLFNLAGVVGFFPFVGLFSRLLLRMFPDKFEGNTLFLHKVSLEVPEAGIEAMGKELQRLLQLTVFHNMSCLQADPKLIFLPGDPRFEELYQNTPSLGDQYLRLKVIQAEIFSFGADLGEKKLMPEESTIINDYLGATRDLVQSAKILKDIKADFDEFRNSADDPLHAQYYAFRKRITDFYSQFIHLVEQGDKAPVSGALTIMENLRREDAEFLERFVSKKGNNGFSDIHFSTLLVVNRAFVLSERYLLSALRNLLFNQTEQEELESFSLSPQVPE